MSDKTTRAFPFHLPDPFIAGGSTVQSQGMSLRDYFASHAPDIGTINVKADREALAGRAQPEMWPNGLDSIRFNAEVEAALQYLYADAMLAERAK